MLRSCLYFHDTKYQNEYLVKTQLHKQQNDKDALKMCYFMVNCFQLQQVQKNKMSIKCYFFSPFFMFICHLQTIAIIINLAYQKDYNLVALIDKAINRELIFNELLLFLRDNLKEMQQRLSNQTVLLNWKEKGKFS